MIERKHTPGEWKKIGDFVGPSTFEPVCRMVRSNVNTSSQANANQDLISAAPDMLSVLLEMSEFWECGSPVRDGSDVVDDAYRAIRKALGVRS